MAVRRVPPTLSQVERDWVRRERRPQQAEHLQPTEVPWRLVLGTLELVLEGRRQPEAELQLPVPGP